ncbi:sugar phosphate isomerase/epimerase family protein [Georgenia subflava]|uniref:TIM barrel protein n=1 Tax=Georgenia subflava TaxID=1622177 RepID=A0A6N7ENE6_9MICO|nr:sugar phosphate isomerase/epimerase [Georgenia subflava]MPV38623.1 TIM barrel protein [Georgenia subflava]
MTLSTKNRRNAVVGAAGTIAMAAGLLAAAPAVAAPASDNANSNAQCAGRSVPASKISFQMYSYAGWTGWGGENTEQVLAELAEVGYRNIEPFGGTFDGLSAGEVTDLLDEYGLKAPTSHGSTDEASWDTTLDYAKEVGQRYMGSGGFASPGIGTYEDVLATAATLDRLGERSVKNGTGKIFGHNHGSEFTTTYTDPETGDVKSAWEIIVENTDPRYVTFQLDTYWAADAGVDVAALIEEHGDRIELLHIKDGDLNGTQTDVGEGVMEWGPILEAAQGHVKYYVIEQDGAEPSIDFAEESFDFLTCFSF